MIERVVTDTLRAVGTSGAGVLPPLIDIRLAHIARAVGTSGAGVLPPLIDIRLAHIASANHEFHVGNGQMWSGAAQHPRRWIVLVLVDALVEVDLVEVAQKGEPMQGNSPLRAPFFDVLLELHLPLQYRHMDGRASVDSPSGAMTASAALAARARVLRSSTARMPAACAPAMSCTSLSPTMTVADASVPSARSAAAKILGDGLRHPTSAENVTASRWVSRPRKTSCACSERTR